jgi:hypothetical protein
MSAGRDRITLTSMDDAHSTQSLDRPLPGLPAPALPRLSLPPPAFPPAPLPPPSLADHRIAQLRMTQSSAPRPPTPPTLARPCDESVSALASRSAAVVIAAIAWGLAVGVGTQVMQGVLLGGWNVLANSSVAWCIAAFAFGLALGRVGVSRVVIAAGGSLSLIVASYAYYAAVGWFEGSGSNGRSALLWAMAGTVAGAFFAAAGSVARAPGPERLAAWALVAGILLQEGRYLGWHVGVGSLRSAAVVELVLGGLLATYVVIASGRAWWRTAGFVVISFVAYAVGVQLLQTRGFAAV